MSGKSLSQASTFVNENEKKQVPLRISSKLYEALSSWADEEFRSVNGQIEYLLTECVRTRKKNGKNASAEMAKQLESYEK